MKQSVIGIEAYTTRSSRLRCISLNHCFSNFLKWWPT